MPSDEGIPTAPPAPLDSRRASFGENEELTALAKRLAQAIAAAEAAPPESQPRAIVFRVGPVRAALPLAAIREVVGPPEQMSRVPRAPEALLGIMNLRGRVVVIVDPLFVMPAEVTRRLAGALESGERTALATGRVLILERNRREVGLLVASVEGIAALHDLSATDATLLDPQQLTRAVEALVE